MRQCWLVLGNTVKGNGSGSRLGLRLSVSKAHGNQLFPALAVTIFVRFIMYPPCLSYTLPASGSMYPVAVPRDLYPLF